MRTVEHPGERRELENDSTPPAPAARLKSGAKRTREEAASCSSRPSAGTEPSHQPGMDGKNLGKEQQAQQKKSDAVTPSRDQESFERLPVTQCNNRRAEIKNP